MDFIEDTYNDIIRLRTKIKISEFIINISKNKNDNEYLKKSLLRFQLITSICAF